MGAPFSAKPEPVPALSRHRNGSEGADRVLPEQLDGRTSVGDYPWHEIDADDLAVGEVKAVVTGGRAVCLTRTPNGLGALDNRCPHQGGPLGEGTIEDRWPICPWHGYEYDPLTGESPAGYGDSATPLPLAETDGAIAVGLPVVVRSRTLMDQMVDVMVDGGVDSVFGMVGHSNLGLADALRSAESAPCGAWGVRRHGRITSDRVDLGRRRPRSISRRIHHGGEVRHADHPCGPEQRRAREDQSRAGCCGATGVADQFGEPGFCGVGGPAWWPRFSR